jgi:protein SCO1/2
MTDRRKFFLLAAAASASAMAGDMSGPHGHGHGHKISAKLMGASQFPETTVQTHEGATVRLYADLVRGKVVMLNFMSIEGEKTNPVSEKLAQVVHLLRPYLEHEVRILSISGDPKHDTAKRLREFAAKLGAPKGWYFLRASEGDNVAVASRFYRHGRDTRQSSKLDIVQYGNDRVGLWGAFPSSITADDAAMRVRSVMNGKKSTGPLVQAGPRVIGGPGPSYNHRAV